MKRILTAIIIFAAVSLSAQENRDYTDYRIYARASISKIEINKIKNEQGINLSETWIFLEVLDGEYKGETKKAVFGGESDLPEEMQYKTGQTVFIGIAQGGTEGSVEYISLYDVDNTKSMIFLMVLVVAAIIAVGKLKGLASLFALIVTIMMVFVFLIPYTLKGYPPLPIAVIISIVSIILTLPIIAGFHLKTLAAIMGAVCGIILASLLAMFFGWIMHLSGIVTNDMLTVFYASSVKIDVKGLVLSGMIIAALGAIMDICISIASSTAEIFSANPEIDEKRAFKSVLNIGTDILGSMVNTLILAYVGSSLSLILFISMRLQPDMSIWMILNYNPVLSEIVKSAIGSIGLFISIPLTAIISVKLYKKYYRTAE